MKTFFHRHILFVTIILLGITTSCQKEEELLDKQNPNRITAATYFKTQNDAVLAVNAAYAPLNSGYMYDNQYFHMFDIGLEMSPTSNCPATWHISTYTFNGAHPLVSDIWTGLYQIVQRANFAIGGIETMTNLNETIKKRLLGEAYFLRGWAYFELVFNYGRVPLYTAFPGSIEAANQPRSTTELEIYQQVIKDFETAEANLPNSYTGSDIGRVTKGAAVGYLGKVYLYMASPGVNLNPQGYAKAEQYFRRLTVGGEFNYGLMDNYVDNFTQLKENNKESLFEVQHTNAGTTGKSWGNSDFLTASEGSNRARTFGYLTWWNAYMNENHIKRFPDTDPRLRLTAYGPPTPANPQKMQIFGGATYDRADWNSRKYERYDYIPAAQEDGESPINFRVMRFADVLLMLAEALNEQGKTSEVTALINQVRQRVGAKPITVSTQNDLRQAIRDERLWELSLEQLRKKDVLRWGPDVAESEFDLAGIEAFEYKIHRYLPIPQNEIDANLAIDLKDQNPGY